MIWRKVALYAAIHLHIRRCPFGGNRIIQGHAIGPGGPRKAHIALPRFARKGDDGQAGVAGFQRRDDLLAGRQGEIDEILAFQAAGPTVKQLDHLGPRMHLHREVFHRCIGDAVDQGGKGGAVCGFQRMGRGLIRCAAPGDHIGGHGPGRTGKPDQGGVARQFAHEDAQGFIDRGKVIVDGIGRFQSGQFARRGDGGQPWAFAGFKPQIGPHGLWQQQDIGEQDCRIKPVAADRLQRNLGCQIGIVAQFQEITGLRAGGAVFGQIAAGLPHHPDRRGGQLFTAQGAQDRLFGRHTAFSCGGLPKFPVRRGLSRRRGFGR